MDQFLEDYVAARSQLLQSKIRSGGAITKTAKAVAQEHGQNYRSLSARATLQTMMDFHELQAVKTPPDAKAQASYFLDEAVTCFLEPNEIRRQAHKPDSFTLPFTKSFFLEALHFGNEIKLGLDEYNAGIAKAETFIKSFPVYIPCKDYDTTRIDPVHLIAGKTKMACVRALFSMPANNNSDVLVLCVWSPVGANTVIEAAGWLLCASRTVFNASHYQNEQFAETVMTGNRLLTAVVGKHLDDSGKRSS